MAYQLVWVSPLARAQDRLKRVVEIHFGWKHPGYFQGLEVENRVVVDPRDTLEVGQEEHRIFREVRTPIAVELVVETVQAKLAVGNGKVDLLARTKWS